MRKLLIPALLSQEFATVEAIWESDARTRRVDALLLAWIKYEKQLRRLFCFVVFQHSNISETKIASYIDALTSNNDFYSYRYIQGIKALGAVSVADLIGPRARELSIEIERIRKHRNKFVHGQMAGTRITSRQIERDVLWIIDWVSSLANGAKREIGYDGLDHKTYTIAKGSPKIATKEYPFSTAEEFKAWLEVFAPPRKQSK